MNNFLFENEEEFGLYLANTSSYQNMQNAVSKVVSFIKPQYMIELGSGSGATTIRLARENSQTSFVACDLREKMVGIGNEGANKNRIKNVTFIHGDLTKLDNLNVKNADAILMLNSFRFVADPLENKGDFLDDMHRQMQCGAFLIIGDTFISNEETKPSTKKLLTNLYNSNSNDVFWSNLKGLSKLDVREANKIKEQYKEKMNGVVETQTARDGVFFVSKDWIYEQAEKVGFEVVVSENLNSQTEAVIVLKK